MPNIDLFPKALVAGVFRGFQQGGLEFHADLLLPYRSHYQNRPMHGQFLLVQLDTPDEAVLGRITSFSSEGKLSTGSGEAFNIRATLEDRQVPEELREQYISYRVNIRVLGVLRKNHSELTFVSSHRRLPHVGSKVAFPSPEVMREIAGHNDNGAEIGHLAFGEYIFAKKSKSLCYEEWMQLIKPEVSVKFTVESLLSRRSFIFARAGFGKSNLNKLLFSKLYENTPYVLKRRNKKVPVGTVIFDPDGEYFWPDDKGRPGLCDVPALEDKLVVFTSRTNPSLFYQSFVAGGIRLDIRRLRPSDVIAIALDPERQQQQNVRKLRGLPQDRWEKLVNLIDVNGNSTDINEIKTLLELGDGRQEVEAVAARANLTTIVRMLHDKSSMLMDILIDALSKGKICVVDVSQMRGNQSLVLSGLILRRIFDRNQAEFTQKNPATIPVIAVVEEAQTVLNERSSVSEPYISWVKEGRKYDLGSLMITQQPGGIPAEILSQGDNWFVFHLLSAVDLYALKKANAHFSDDIISSLLNEPIPGHGVMWSSVGSKPYPISMRVHLFETMYSTLDPNYDRPAAATYALEKNAMLATSTNENTDTPSENVDQEDNDEILEQGQIDVKARIENELINMLKHDDELMSKIKSDKGVAWGTLKAYFKQKTPDQIVDDKDGFAFNLVKPALNEIFGHEGWKSYRNEERGGTMYVQSEER